MKKIDTSSDAVDRLAERMSGPGLAPTIYQAAETLTSLAADRDRWRDSSNSMTEMYEHRGRLLEQEHSRAEAAEAEVARLTAERDALRAQIKTLTISECLTTWDRGYNKAIVNVLTLFGPPSDNSTTHQKTAG